MILLEPFGQNLINLDLKYDVQNKNVMREKFFGINEEDLDKAMQCLNFA